MSWDEVIRVLCTHNFSLTPVRHRVVEVLHGLRRPVSHDELMGLLPADTDRVTVYRTMNKLVEIGVVTKFEGDDKKSYFELPHTPHHAHFICKKCQSISCLDELKIELPEGFKGQEITVRGECPLCSA
jgi:Fur family ferric uptake transcriptional regulator